MKKKGRILHIIDRYQRKGAELFANRLASFLACRGFETFLCGLYESNTEDFPASEPPKRLSPIARHEGLLAQIGFQPSVLLGLARVFRELKPQIVIAHGSDTLKYTALARQLCPGPLLLYRNIGVASFWVNNWLRTFVNRQLMKMIDGVVSVCQASREDFIEVYKLPSSKVVSILNGIDFEPYHNVEVEPVRHQIRLRLGLTERDILLISVGSLSAEKNQGELLTLLNELREISPHLLLVGDGPLRRELERQADELGIRQFVHFLGVQADVVPWLAASDIFLLPSESEGMPGVLIEAGMAGLPSVAYGVGGVAEVIEQNSTGIIVPSRNHHEFRTAVVSLFNNPQERRQMGALARQQYPERFGMGKIAGEWEVLISNLLTEKRKQVRWPE